MDDLEKYRDILNSKGFDHTNDEMADLIKQSEKAELPAGKGKQEIWNQIEKSIDQKETKSTKETNFKPWILAGIAASILLVAIMIILMEDRNQHSPVQIIANATESIDHQLPDLSRVNLNAHSALSYEATWNRTITLSGEAFFEVTKGSVFNVKTNLGEVQVLGTSFNVLARDSIFEVACKTGKVKVSIPEKNLIQELTPGMKLAATMDTVFRNELTPEEIGNWTTGEFYFNNRPIREVFDEVERQYKTKIDLNGMDSLHFTGYFFTTSDLKGTLDIICLPLGLDFEKSDKGYLIRNSREAL